MPPWRILASPALPPPRRPKSSVPSFSSVTSLPPVFALDPARGTRRYARGVRNTPLNAGILPALPPLSNARQKQSRHRGAQYSGSGLTFACVARIHAPKKRCSAFPGRAAARKNKTPARGAGTCLGIREAEGHASSPACDPPRPPPYRPYRLSSQSETFRP